MAAIGSGVVNRVAFLELTCGRHHRRAWSAVLEAGDLCVSGIREVAGCAQGFQPGLELFA
jgi:hypothetical protein